MRGPGGARRDCVVYVGELPDDVREREVEDLFWDVRAFRSARARFDSFAAETPSGAELDRQDILFKPTIYLLGPMRFVATLKFSCGSCVMGLPRKLRGTHSLPWTPGWCSLYCFSSTESTPNALEAPINKTAGSVAALQRVAHLERPHLHKRVLIVHRPPCRVPEPYSDAACSSDAS